jgi:hypothetical protein
MDGRRQDRSVRADHALVVDGGGVSATEDTKADRNEVTHWSYRTNNLAETAVRDIISPPEGATLRSVMADLRGFGTSR